MTLRTILGSLPIAFALLTGPVWMASAAVRADQSAETIKFAVVRNGDQIGTHTIDLQRNGKDTLVQISTKVEVKIAFFTAYRFEHNESERWVNGQLMSMTSVTDDNGTVHKVNVAADAKADGLKVEADGKVTQVERDIVPASFWNAAILRQKVALNPQDGTVMPITVSKVGTERLSVQGRPTMATRYSIQTTYTQDVWYDDQGRLLKAQFHGSDGSIIWYQLI
jgi:hypothetical protein